MMIDWNELFAFTVSPLELMIRGTLVYWFLFMMFRTVLQRDLGAVGMADMLLVLVADAAQNAMAAEYRSVSDGLVLISTIIEYAGATCGFCALLCDDCAEECSNHAHDHCRMYYAVLAFGGHWVWATGSSSTCRAASPKTNGRTSTIPRPSAKSTAISTPGAA